MVAPGQIGSPSSSTLLTAPQVRRRSSVRRRVVRGNPCPIRRQLGAATRDQALAVLLIATIGLTFIGLLAVAGFTVMGHRRSACAGHDRRDRRARIARYDG